MLALAHVPDHARDHGRCDVPVPTAEVEPVLGGCASARDEARRQVYAVVLEDPAGSALVRNPGSRDEDAVVVAAPGLVALVRASRHPVEIGGREELVHRALVELQRLLLVPPVARGLAGPEGSLPLAGRWVNSAIRNAPIAISRQATRGMSSMHWRARKK